MALRLPSAPDRRRRSPLAVALVTLALLYVGALAVLSTEPVERLLHHRLHDALQARLGEVRLGEEVEVDPLLRLSFGPLELPSAAGGPPLLRAERVAVRASLGALLRGRLEPATVLLGDVRLRPGADGRELRALLERSRGRRAFDAAAGVPQPADRRELPKIKLRGLVATVLLDGGPLEVGPIDADLRVLRRADGGVVRADVSLRGGGRLTLDAEQARGSWRVSLRGEDLGPTTLPAPLRGRAAAVTGGRGTFAVEGEVSADLSRGTARVDASLDDLVLAGERIAAVPVGPLEATGSARLEWDLPARRLRLSDGRATLLGAATVTGAGEVLLGPPATFTAALRAERVEWSAVLSALPPPLSLPPQAPRPAGPLSARLDLSGPLLAPDEWSVDAALDLAGLREAARRGGRSPLADPFTHRPPLDAGGHGPELRVGPGSPDFVPIAELPEHVLRAVTTSEDGGFFGHAGFDFDELRNAIAAGARRGRLVRGGSTISQQVAKNLFLGPERTFARKAREAAITVGLEATLPKRRILEIYLNVAEWGPGIWGIGPAARHWFAKDARALTAKEAAFLASVIPSPVRYHEALFARGALSEPWEARVLDLLVTMNLQGALGDAALAEAVAEPIAFPLPGPAPRGGGAPGTSAPAATAADATAAPDPAEAGAPPPEPLAAPAER